MHYLLQLLHKIKNVYLHLIESSNLISWRHLSHGGSSKVRFIKADISACSLLSRTIWRCRLFPSWLPERYERSSASVIFPPSRAKLSRLWFFWGKRARHNGTEGRAWVATEKRLSRLYPFSLANPSTVTQSQSQSVLLHRAELSPQIPLRDCRDTDLATKRTPCWTRTTLTITAS